MNTIQIRKARPSVLALALALLLTMIFVYAVSLPALPGMQSEEASAEAPISTELRMEGLEAHFIIEERCGDELQARILAARCAEAGGAGLILKDGNAYAVVREMGGADSEGALSRSAAGLTLKLEGSAAELAAVTDAVAFLRAQAGETGSLAAALEAGDTDASSLRALLSVYKTQGQRVLNNLNALSGHAAVDMLRGSVSSCLVRLDAAIADTRPSSMRLVHAAACAEWIGILEGIR
ncbi:MAG: hypothetical protein IJ466_08585 [Clostridia bacterium]|nr:hypothetical protein [Clostridia bacterium]